MCSCDHGHMWVTVWSHMCTRVYLDPGTHAWGSERVLLGPASWMGADP